MGSERGRRRFGRPVHKKKGPARGSLKLTEEQIDEILDRFIVQYFRKISTALDDSVRLALDKLRDYLRSRSESDFADAADFADKVLKQLDGAWGNGWSSVRVRKTIDDTTRSIYEFYRLRDVTVFGDSSPIRLRLRGPDTKSIKFIGELDHFYFSKFADNTDTNLRKFFVDSYLKDGAALFGRESSDELAAFRAAAGDKLRNLTDRQTHAIVHTAVARIRNWAHIGSLDQAQIELAKLVATLDSRTTVICREIDGKIIRVGVAQKAIQRLNGLEPKEFAKQLYGSDLAKRLRQDPAANIRQYLEEDGVTIGDDMVETGLGFPPFHTNCRTRTEGVIEGIKEDE